VTPPPASILSLRVPIPTDWSPAQAQALLDFLDALHDAIWRVYEAPLVEKILRDLEAGDRAQEEPSSLPEDVPW